MVLIGIVILKNFGVNRFYIWGVALGIIKHKTTFLKGIISSTLGVLRFMQYIAHLWQKNGDLYCLNYVLEKFHI